MNESIVTLFALVTGILHLLAYLVYVRFTVRDEVQPNPTSWLMWTYGTALVVILEWDQEGSFVILLLPIVCSASSLLVALLCWRKGRLAWPEDLSDRAAFLSDLLITALYILLVLLATNGMIADSRSTAIKTMLLVLVNVSTFVSFWPILRSTRIEPDNEHWLAWALWTTAYALLCMVTLGSEGFSWYGLQFLLYPASCMVLSGMVCWYSLKSTEKVPLRI